MSRYNPFEERRKNERINRLVKENTELKSKVDKLEQDYDSKRLYADLMEQAVKFAQSQTQELKEQNAELVELVERCKDVIYAYNDHKPTATGNEILQAIQDRLTKYNHLK